MTIESIIDRHNEIRPDVYRLSDDQKEAVAQLCKSLTEEVRTRPFDATRPDPQRGVQLGQIVAEVVGDVYLEAAQAWEAAASENRKLDSLAVHREVER